MAFFMIGAVHVALMVHGAQGRRHDGRRVDACSGCTGDGIEGRRAAAPGRAAPRRGARCRRLPPRQPRAAAAAPSRAIRLGPRRARGRQRHRPRGAAARRETKIVAAAAAGRPRSAGRPNASLSRARGIGSRFRAPANARLARSMEKFK